MNKMGNPTGSGNPPGEYSDSYLTPEGGDSNFLTSSSYKNYGVEVGKGSDVGNQPTGTKMSSLEDRANKTEPY